jgi:hypothetical protein
MSSWLRDGTRVQNINGKLCLVRPRQKARTPSYDLGSVVSIGYDLLSEVFDGSAFKMDKDNIDEAAEAEAGTPHVHQHSHHNHEHPPMMAPTMSAPPTPGVYQQGNRQLVLLPKVPTGQGQGQHHMMHQGHFGYPQHPFMYSGQPQMVPTMGSMGFGGFNSQYDKPVPVDVKTVTPTSVTVTRHICANCGNLRSKRYQVEHPLEPGETAPVSFCKKCEGEFRSTDSEVEVELVTRRGRKHNKKLRKEKHTKKVVFEKVLLPTTHICAQCGNPRSKKYQAAHPLGVGEAPPVAYCRKCQKEVTSSEDSSMSDESNGETVTYVSHRRNRSGTERSYYRDRRIKVRSSYTHIDL